MKPANIQRKDSAVQAALRRQLLPKELLWLSLLLPPLMTPVVVPGFWSETAAGKLIAVYIPKIMKVLPSATKI